MTFPYGAGLLTMLHTQPAPVPSNSGARRPATLSGRRQLLSGAAHVLQRLRFRGLPSRQLVALDSGMVELAVTFDRGGIGAGTEPATFVSARGSFREVSFEQRDYFKLVYSPENHHFVQHFAVFFDAPIQGACGLEIVNVPGPPSVRRRMRAWTVDCQLTRLDEIAVTGVMAL